MEAPTANSLRTIQPAVAPQVVRSTVSSSWFSGEQTADRISLRSHLYLEQYSEPHNLFSSSTANLVVPNVKGFWSACTRAMSRRY